MKRPRKRPSVVRREPERADRFGLPQAAQVAAVAVASIAAVAGFRAVFADWSFITSALIGGWGAAAIIGLAWSRRLLIGETVALSAVALVVIGTVGSNGIPTPGAFGAFFDGLVNGWSDLLSQTPPLDVTAQMRVLPLTLAWLGTTVGGELIRRTSAPTLSTIGPLMALSVSVLVTAEDRTVGLVQGAIIALVTLGVGLAQMIRANDGDDTADVAAEPADDPVPEADVTGIDAGASARTKIRIARAAAALVVVAVAAPFAGPRLPFASAYERFDLRDRNVPPFDPLLISSPLVQVKQSLKDGVRDDVVFTVRADEPIERFDLAILGAYNGVVWTVGSSDAIDPQIEFRPVGTNLPDRPIDLDVASQQRSVTITIGDLDGPWLPTAGWPDRLEITQAPPAPGPAEDGSAAVDQRRDLRMNLVTGTLAIPGGVRPGFTYDLDLDLPQRPTDAELEALPVQTVAATDDDDNAVIPGSIRNIAADILEGVDQGYARLVAVRDAFVTDGFYDTSPESRPGHSYFRLGEFLDDPQRLVGFEEQYAAAAATISELARLPTRVVVGYLVPADRYDRDGVAEVLSNDISAWIEVDFGAAGWISVDVTPDRSREPTSEAVGKTIEDVAVPSPPPPPDIPPDPELLSNEEEPEEPDEEDEEDEEDEADNESGRLSGGAIAGLVAGSVVALVMLFFAAIALWKARRRSRRRNAADPAARVGWAWRETLDRFGESGLVTPTGATRSTPRETMRSILADPATAPESDEQLRSMVSTIERAAYHSEAPSHDLGDAAWLYYDEMADDLVHRQKLIRRLRMRCDPRPVIDGEWNGRMWKSARHLGAAPVSPESPPESAGAHDADPRQQGAPTP